MKNPMLTAVAGFVLLFILYHAAEYMIVFEDSALGFLSFQGLFFIAAYYVAKWQHKQGLEAWGLDKKKHFLRHLTLGILLGLSFYGLTYFVSLIAGIEKVEQVPSLAKAVVPLGLFIFGSFFSSFSEDVLTRGYLFKHLNGRISNVLFAIVSASVYLLNHIYRLDDGITTWAYLFVLGILYVFPLVLTKRLWFTGGLHWAGNVTFFFTHEIIKTEEISSAVSFNYVLIVVALVFIVLNYFVLTAARFLK